MADVTDEIIMQGVKEGNLSEISVLFERYHIKLYNFFLKLTMKKDVSQDLTQNLFYRMIKYKHTYKNQHSVKPWIYKMARNLHADYCKEKKQAGELFMDTETIPSDVIDTMDSFPEEDYERLDRALEALRDDQKEIIIMSRFHGLKYEEISSISNQSVSAIKVAMHRAIKQLRGIYFKQI